MKKQIIKKNHTISTDDRFFSAAEKRLFQASMSSEESILKAFENGPYGYNEDQVNEARASYGKNEVTHGKRNTLLSRLFGSFVNPFTVVLLVLAGISFFTDIVMVAPEDKSPITVIVITVMVMMSGILRFVQETKSGNVTNKLLQMIHTTVSVQRDGIKKEIPLDEVVVGDIVWLSAGDMIPADMRILAAKDLFVSQSSLTGESEPVEKNGEVSPDRCPLTDTSNLVFAGSTVISGSAKAIVVVVWNETIIGGVAKELNTKPPKSSFEKGVNSVSWVLIRFMLIMVPVVFFVNGFTKGNWMQAALFAISIAVGLTPEMLPMIVTTSLAKGALAMSRQKVVIKNLNAIQNLGSMDVLCTDKTGTLTQDKVVLEYHLNVDGEEDDRVLRHAFLNSYFQTGLKNLIDIAVIDRQKELGADRLIARYEKVDEIPFDFERRRMSVVVKDRTGKTQLVTKGAVEEMLKCCTYVEYKGKIEPLSEQMKRNVFDRAIALNERGMRVIAVAQKTNPSPVGQFSGADERKMVLMGFLAFLDPPKKTAKKAISVLSDYGVQVKVLTGDSEKVTTSICCQVGLKDTEIMLGSQIDELSEEELCKRVERVTVFAKLSPLQKVRIVRALRENGHCVGYMGDGINDAPAMKDADIGVSVDTAVDIAKETASVVLLEKDLTVLEQGVVEGRKTYANMIKYIKMTASSNFGNMLSVLAASAFLPFLPMASLHLILLNLIYDISCTAIPWDNVDSEYLKTPCKWDASGISRFMVWFGPVSTFFDIAVYLLMFFVICPAVSGGQLFGQLTDAASRDLYEAVFQSGWFIASMWTQSLVIHAIRSQKLPFIGSCASVPVLLCSFLGIAAVTLLPFIPLGISLGLSPLPPVFFAYLALIVIGYLSLVTVTKKLFIRRYGSLL